MESSFQLMMYCLNCVGMSFMLTVCVSHAGAFIEFTLDNQHNR
jgi:hypothetical protein